MALLEPGRRGVGRSRELATAAFARDAAIAGRGSFLAITGEPGIGKTWLCETIAEAAKAEGFSVGWGSCWASESAPRLWPWQQAIAELAGPLAAATVSDAPPSDDPAWFAYCVATVDLLRSVTAEAPGLLIFDDVHAADTDSLLLARFVARHVRGLHAVVIVAHQPANYLYDLDRDATVVALHGLEHHEVAAVLTAQGLAGFVDAEIEFLTRMTSGKPHEVLGLASRAPDSGGVISSLINETVAGLPDEIRYGAGCAAVLDRSPRLSEITGVTEGDSASTAAVMATLVAAGLAVRTPPDRFTFTHDRVRDTLQATLDPSEVLNVHARAAAMLGGGPSSVDRLCRRAEHALAATHRSVVDARVAVRATQDAATALIAGNDPARASALLAAATAAHETSGLGRPPASLLTAHGVAELRSGHLVQARELFQQAATAADEDDDPVSLASAALGLGGVWLAEQRSRVDRERVLGLQRRARDELPGSEVALRLRLDVRLAAEESYETGNLEPIRVQLAAARELGDPVVMADALNYYHHTILGPEHSDERFRIARELITVGATNNDDSASLMGLLWLTSDFFMEGDPQGERSLRDLQARANVASGRHASFVASVMDVMLLQRAGRLDEAEQQAHVAFQLGIEVGDADALAYFGAQMGIVRWIQGRAAEVLELAAETAGSPTLTPGNLAFTGVFAAMAAACGEFDRARAVLNQLRGRLKTLPQSSAWLATLFTAVEAAHVVGDKEIAEEAASLMAPYADLPVLGSLAVVCLGSVRRSLGLAALTAGDLDDGIAQLEAAIAHDDRLGNRPFAAITLADLAQALARRGTAGDRQAAITHLDQAIREANAMGLRVRAEEWQRYRQALADDESRHAETVDESVGTLARRGNSWVLTVAGRQVVTPDRLGMQYLSWLLTHPGKEIPAAELASEGLGPAATGIDQEQPVLDEKAMAEYRQRVTDLEDDLAEAERFADTERASRARLELDAIVDELGRMTNRFGRARSFASSAERARTAVQKAVRRSLDHIESVEPALGEALRRSVQTGRICCYQPGPGAPARWIETRLPDW